MQKQTVQKRANPQVVAYHLCPRCFRATPARAGERYCPNDGTLLVRACPSCEANITSPHNRYCTQCGYDFSLKGRR